MPNMSAKASDIDDPGVLLQRIIYRNARLLNRLSDKDDLEAFVWPMAGSNRTDPRRLPILLDVPIEHLSSTQGGATQLLKVRGVSQVAFALPGRQRGRRADVGVPEREATRLGTKTRPPLRANC